MRPGGISADSDKAFRSAVTWNDPRTSSHDLGKVERLQAEVDLARLDLAQIDDVGDERQEVLRTALHHAELLPLLLVQFPGKSLQQDAR